MNIDPGTAIWTLLIVGTTVILLMLLPDVMAGVMNAFRRSSARREKRSGYPRPLR